MKKLLMILALALSANAFAADDYVKTTGLTDKQKAELALQIENLKAAPAASTASNVSEVVRKEAEAWGDLGGNMGKAMVGAAKEIGVAASDFSKTDLGKVTVAVVVYKLIGRDVVGMVLGLGICLFGVITASWMLLTRRWSTVKYEYKPILWGMYQRAYIVSTETDTDTVVGKMIGAFICFGICMLVGIKTAF